LRCLVITISLGDNSGALLPGETVLWTGTPVSSRIRYAETRAALYFLVGLAVLAIWLPGSARGLPILLVSMTALVAAAIAVQFVAGLITILVVRPRARQRETYLVTNWRLLVMTGPPKRRTWSAYLDQLSEPAVGRSRDGVADLPSPCSERPGRVAAYPPSLPATALS